MTRHFIRTRRNFLTMTLIVLVAACAEEGVREVEEVDPADTLLVDHGPVSPADSENLMIVQHIPLGSSYDMVSARFPQVSPLARRDESGGGRAQGQRIARTQVLILGTPVTLEFLFQHEALHSLHYWVRDVHCDQARVLHERIRAFYAERFGSFEEERVVRDGLQTTSSFWRMEDIAVTATMTVEDEQTCIFTWGFKEHRE